MPKVHANQGIAVAQIGELLQRFRKPGYKPQAADMLQVQRILEQDVGRRTRKTTRSRPRSNPARAEGRPGVIASIIGLLVDGGGTFDQLAERLKAQFPERGDKVLTTLRIQLSRLPQQGRVVMHRRMVNGRVSYSAAKKARKPAVKK